MNRYARQMILPEIGTDGQNALAAAHVLLIGAGGLGCPALQYLVGAGVGEITVVDPDTVSLNNLHRQILFTEIDVGRPKVQAACDRLQHLNRDVAINAIHGPFDPAKGPALIARKTVVIDCADSFAASYIASDLCFAAQIPFISASVLGRQGYVGGFCATAPSLRAVFPDLPDTLASCATAGVMGPVVGMLGAAQAQMALAVIIDTRPSPLGQMMNFDMASYRTSGFRFDNAPEPEQALRFVSAADILPEDFVVDLRGISEAPTPVTSHAVRLEVSDFAAHTPRPDPGQRTILTCRSGLRAWQAASHLQTYCDTEISLIAMGDPVS
ncbi:ThiF family adenylyltransferase [Algirhabdus cladophorae]|uniref:ThiF family adenylyltransferase n=1 Tax=Algirhabdus cladophorae TaxID=3377108 RepID=UPI003B845B33